MTAPGTGILDAYLLPDALTWGGGLERDENGVLVPPRVLNSLLSEEFRRLMLLRGMTQKQLAAATGITEPTLSRRFKKGGAWTADETEIVLMALGVDLFDFLSDLRNAKDRIR